MWRGDSRSKPERNILERGEINIAILAQAFILILSCATFVAFIYGARSIFAAVARQQSIDWVRQFGFEFVYWYVWAALSPVVIWFARRFDLQRNRARSVLALIAFGLLMAPLQSTIEFSFAYSIDFLSGVPAGWVFDDGVHKVELYRFANPYAAEMIVAYLPKEKILLEADMLDILRTASSRATIPSRWRNRSRSLDCRWKRLFRFTVGSARWRISAAR